MTLTEWVVVFDLDDTLISELEYQRSGIAAVEQCVTALYKVPFEKRIQSALDEGVHDIWAWTCDQLDLPVEIKTSLLWIYRLHRPRIKLVDGIQSLLKALKSHGAQLAILSDGRSVTQRLKLSAVGLEDISVFLSEDYGSTKPNPQRFIAIENKWPRLRYAYIADNPAKDFEVPCARDWLAIGARWVIPKVHPYPESDSLSGKQPHYWLDNPSEVLSLILNS
ncbi:HAD family hydrolase [Vulcanococcus limneticus]|uniref:HAD family hydrolase n=1 Tax=Vulcanococcus limneticus TaxID=2170428 RepID=UPI00398BE4A4